MTRRIVLVTGGAGFIGSNVVARLCEDPALDVVVCDRLRDAAGHLLLFDHDSAARGRLENRQGGGL